MRKLTKLQVDALTKQVGVHLIEDNLFLRVREGKRGNRSHWLFRYTFKGKDEAKSFGTYPEVTLAEASAEAHEWRRDLAHGIDPIAKREAAEAKSALLSHTFQEAAADYLEKRRGQMAVATWQIRAGALRNHVNPVIGDIPVNDIDVQHVTAVLEPIWVKIPVQAELVNR
jgi:Arm DNA-binding domain/Phage integrase central domain